MSLNQTLLNSDLELQWLEDPGMNFDNVSGLQN